MPSETELLFIIPLKSARASKDWAATQKMLNSTLRSIEAQTNANHHTIIVCNERPEISANRSRTTLVEADTRLEGEVTKLSAQKDKMRKLYFGLMTAAKLKERTKRIMFLDADDLLHRKLVEDVSGHDAALGQIIKHGFRYVIGDRHFRRSFNFHDGCGSSMIFPFDRSRFSASTSSDDHMSFFMTRAAHVKPIEAIFRREGISYRYVTFPACIYIRGSNDSVRDISLAESNLSVNAQPGRTLHTRVKRLTKRARNYYWKALGRLQGNVAIDEVHLRDFSGLSDYVPIPEKAWQA